MDQELKSKWLEALRSGRYQQTKGVLKDERGHCCIGVLCDVIDPDAWLTKNGEACWRTEDIYGNLSSSLASVLGVRDHCEYLPSLNDKGVSFAQIADIIESDDIKGGYTRITGISADDDGSYFGFDDFAD